MTRKKEFTSEELELLEEVANQRGFKWQKIYKNDKEGREFAQRILLEEIKEDTKKEAKKQQEIKARENDIKDIKTFTNKHNERILKTILKTAKKDNSPPPIVQSEKSEQSE